MLLNLGETSQEVDGSNQGKALMGFLFVCFFFNQDEGKGHVSILEIYKIEAVVCLFQMVFHEAFGRCRQENQEFEAILP